MERELVIEKLISDIEWFFKGTGNSQIAISGLASHLYNKGYRIELPHPVIVCLCGSTRFGKAFQDANLKETLAGKIVLSIGCNMRSDTEIFGSLPEAELKRIKTELDELHKRKIDLADEVLVLNVGGYIGESTLSELSYAYSKRKVVRFIEPSEALLYNWNWQGGK